MHSLQCENTVRTSAYGHKLHEFVRPAVVRIFIQYDRSVRNSARIETRGSTYYNTLSYRLWYFYLLKSRMVFYCFKLYYDVFLTAQDMPSAGRARLKYETCFKVLPLQLSGRIEENYENLQSVLFTYEPIWNLPRTNEEYYQL